MALPKRKKHKDCSGWPRAVELCRKMATQPAKADALLERGFTELSHDERRRCQRLFFGVLRWWFLLDELLQHRVHRPPRPELKALLQVAGFELIEACGEGTLAQRGPQVVHFAVEQTRALTSEPEARLVNAVLRRWLEDLPPLLAGSDFAERALPRWLRERWQQAFGAEALKLLAGWCVQPAEVYARWHDSEPPEHWQPTPWAGYWKVPGGDWPTLQEALATGKVYLQDPFARVPVNLLDVQPGETVLDLCAAPGGKTIALLEALGQDESGALLAVDRPGPRLQQLDENLRRHHSEAGPQVQVLASDLRQLDPAETGRFHAVMLDAPCSNTGVIRRRPDVKLRLQPADIERCAALQLTLLRKAATFVAPGGRLVYSTCSIEAEENQAVVQAFLASEDTFHLAAERHSYPWECDHDGGGAALLIKSPEVPT